MLVGRGLERLDRSRSHHILSQEEVSNFFPCHCRSAASAFCFSSIQCLSLFFFVKTQFQFQRHLNSSGLCCTIYGGFRWQEERPPPGQSWRSPAPSRTSPRLSGDSSTSPLSTSMTTHSFAYHPPFPSYRCFLLYTFFGTSFSLILQHVKCLSESQAAGLVQ